MRAGTRFRLSTSTLTVGSTPRGRVAVTIPAGEIVKVAAEPHAEDCMVNVLYNGRLLSMFVVDLESRGEELPEASGAHS